MSPITIQFRPEDMEPLHRAAQACDMTIQEFIRYAAVTMAVVREVPALTVDDPWGKGTTLEQDAVKQAKGVGL